MAKAQGKSSDHEPVIENRQARHDYHIEETLECGISLRGTEVKSVRRGLASLAEGYVRATAEPAALELHGVHIAEYPPAGAAHQHAPTRTRVLLAHKREIRKLAGQTSTKGTTIVPLRMYFKEGRVKVLIGVATGKTKVDNARTSSRAKRGARSIAR